MPKPSKLTSETSAAVLDALRAGQPPTQAAVAGGVAAATAQAWIHRGRREPEGKYRDFAAQYQSARAVARAVRTTLQPPRPRRVTTTTTTSGIAHDITGGLASDIVSGPAHDGGMMATLRAAGHSDTPSPSQHAAKV